MQRIKSSFKNVREFNHNRLEYELIDKYLLEYIGYFRGRLLEVGCDSNLYYKEFFLEHCEEYIGAQSSSFIENYTRANFTFDNFDDIDFKNILFDCIIIINDFGSIPNVESFLKRAFNVLDDKGSILIRVPFQQGILNKHDFFRYSSYGIKHILEKTGFKDIKIQPMGSIFVTLVLKINIFSLRLTKKSSFWRFIFRPIWFISQKMALRLDNMHRGWSLEANSFFVIAKKF